MNYWLDETAIRIGDVVWCDSLLSKMTVENILPNRHYYCTWFDMNNECHSHIFPHSEIDKIFR